MSGQTNPNVLIGRRLTEREQVEIFERMRKAYKPRPRKTKR